MVALCVLAGCAHGASLPNPYPTQPTISWPMYQAVASHNAVFARNGFRVSWSRGLGGRLNGGLSVVGNTLYVASFDHRLYALNALTGAVRWSTTTDNILMSTPVVAHGVVLVGSGKSGFLRPGDWTSAVWGRPQGDAMYAFDTGGKRRWAMHTNGENMPSAAAIGDEVIFANGDLHAYALNSLTGKILWQTALPGIVSMASITVDDGMAFVGTCHNAPHRCATVALNVWDGHVVWQTLEGGSDASPTVADGLVFLSGNREGSARFRPGGHDVITALDEKTGARRWQYVGSDGPVTLLASAEHAVAGAASDGILYQSINTADEVVALDEYTGKLRWSVQTYAPVKMSPVISGDRVYFGDSAGLLYTIDRRDGAILATSAMKGPFSTAPFVIVGKTLFAANGNNLIAVPLEELEQH